MPKVRVSQKYEPGRSTSISIITDPHRRTRRGVGGAAAFPDLKIFRANSVFRASASCSKILNDKKTTYSIQWKIPGQLCFSGQAQVVQNSWIIKYTYAVQWVRAPSVFQCKRKLLKNPECNLYIQYNEKFQGKHELLKTPECKKYIQYSEQIQGNSVFSGQRKLLKNRERWKIFQYDVYSLGGDPCNLA